MISFTNDYSEGAHPKVLELLMKSNLEQNKGYGMDIHCDRAKEYIKKEIRREDVDIHFIPGGTQTNLLVISSFLRPHQCVIAADTGHINVHETGAVEATGHKVLTMPSEDGKLTPSAVRKALESHMDEHMVQPKMVYISDTTELGTVYTKTELTALHEICRDRGLLLFLDGARLASALTCKANDLELWEIARLVDVFYIGGTKNGALLGEALVICREDLKEDFRYMIKQRGAMLAKGFVMGIQFEALFQQGEVPVWDKGLSPDTDGNSIQAIFGDLDGDMECNSEWNKSKDVILDSGLEKGKNKKNDLLYYSLGKHANRMAEQLADAMKKRGYEFYTPVCSNQLFPIIPDDELQGLGERFIFQKIEKADEKHTAVRFVTSWATSQENVDALIKYLQM